MESRVDLWVELIGASGSNLVTLLIWSDNFNENCLRYNPDGSRRNGMILASCLVDEFMISKIQNFEWDFEQLRQ